jgi:dipeptidyl aminopeptidase/acylaminoacyl peptidase
MRKFLLFLAATAAPAAMAAGQSTLAQDAAAFGIRESVTDIDLSPNGRNVVYIEPTGASGVIAYIADGDTGATKPFLKSSGGPQEKLRWCRFVTDTRLICRYTGMIRYQDDKLVGFARLIAINSDGSGIKQLGQRESWNDSRLRQVDGNVIDWLPGGRGDVLMSRVYIPEENRTGSRLGRGQDGVAVDRINTLTLTTDTIEKPRKGVGEYMSDGRGNVRVLVIQEDNGSGELTGRSRIEYRPAGSRQWTTLAGFVHNEIVPLAVDAASDSLYALKKLSGRYALYRVKLTSAPAWELVASHPKVDIDDVVRSARGQSVIGYTYVDDKRQTIYFDAAHKQLATSLGKALPGLPLIRFAGGSQDGNRSIIFAGSDGDPGRYYVYDRATKQLNELFAARPQLASYKAVAVKPVSVKASDGTMIPAYLTLPTGKAPKGLAAVVLPHGGPSSRDEWGFDWLAQFLAARGYAVIQPNYRGSAGFGDHWLMENGFKSWRTSVGDITDSLRWLVSEGIADPNRLAAVGWSYGGYAALQAAAVDPGLLKAVVAVAPVTDLNLLKDEHDGFASYQLVAQFIGSGAHIAEGSPLRRANSIKAQVLLAHGDMDQNVGVRHSEKMEAALRSSGTSVELLRYKGLDHQLDDSAARRDLLIKIGALLDRTINK